MKNLYESITSRLLSEMEKGVLPWRRPWEQGRMTIQVPMNAKTRKPYQGINVLLLWLQARSSPYWATKNTWAEIGATVKDEVPTEVAFYVFRKGKAPFSKTYEVYNLEQVSGCDNLRDATTNQYSPGAAEQLIQNTRANIVANAPSAWYDMVEDTIYCPSREQFPTGTAYDSTRLHELGHWTGHRSRLHRVFGSDKRSNEYAFEELIAELTSCFVAAEMNMETDLPNQASYMQSWLNIMHADSAAILRAASAAQKASKYILAYKG